MILGYDKVRRFIVIPSIEWPLPVLGCGWGYDKDWPYTVEFSNIYMTEWFMLIHQSPRKNDGI